MKFIKLCAVLFTIISFSGVSRAAEKFCHYKVKGSKVGDLWATKLDDFYTYDQNVNSCLTTAINALYRNRAIASEKNIRSFSNSRIKFSNAMNANYVVIAFTANDIKTFNKSTLDAFLDRNPYLILDDYEFDGKYFEVSFYKNENISRTSVAKQ